MAIFNKTDQRSDYASNVTTLADGCRFSGKVELLCALHIDGEFDGEIASTNSVTIGKTGAVRSELKAEKLVIAGKFIGTAECEVIELVAGGKAEGKLTAASLSIDGGSSFQGESVRKPSNSTGAVVEFRKETANEKSALNAAAANAG